jgi:16S rRNA (cytosine1402-N4)-methyltransferase
MNVHKTVLLHETIDGLKLKAGDILLDGTVGGGGHAALAAQIFHDSITIIGLDMDEEALKRSEEALKPLTSRFTLKHANFRTLDTVLDEIGEPLVDKIVLDLGLSSNQLELSERGFSFNRNEPLLMTFKTGVTENDTTAREIVNEWAEESIADIIYGYGEEQFARRIAAAIVEGRKVKPIETTYDLVDLIKKGTPFWYHFRKVHPATKTFQALRIAVNDELQALTEGMQKGFERLKKDGRMAIISFHSLEDRLVKHFYRKLLDEGLAEITKKPIAPGIEEVSANPRSRSAKLRILQKK